MLTLGRARHGSVMDYGGQVRSAVLRHFPPAQVLASTVWKVRSPPRKVALGVSEESGHHLWTQRGQGKSREGIPECPPWLSSPFSAPTTARAPTVQLVSSVWTLKASLPRGTLQLLLRAGGSPLAYPVLRSEYCPHGPNGTFNHT